MYEAGTYEYTHPLHDEKPPPLSYRSPGSLTPPLAVRQGHFIYCTVATHTGVKLKYNFVVKNTNLVN